MKRHFGWFIVATVLGATSSQGGCSKLGGGSGSAAQPKTEDQKTLYALGLMLGKNIGVFNLKKDELEMVRAGMTSAVLKEKSQIELETYGPKIDAMARARQATASVAEKEKAKAAIEAASKEPGAIKTASGMVIRTIKPGTGPMPAETDKVKVHYVGTLLDGTEFDSSVKRKEPATFPLNGVIKCWTEGVQKMKVGEKAKLICPSEIAYGDNGRPPTIPGGATLLFDVELLEIVK
ncbi:MAG TPA: FKBP-type peptidyl-prolyl cis-trans isomerase [Polyangia bacterium]|jgi:FKBP-type peptidyl-prolyl cis-trans isomerase FkpA|nr:FKBP-type peptidyl-prolyl cis-trans isomerase [Polyangia bacterium]